MSLTIEDGTIVANADSFVTLKELSDWAIRVGKDELLTEHVAYAEPALKVAALYLNNNYRRTFQGKVVEADQSLPWPRSGARDDLGTTIANTVIPANVKNAQCQLALDALQNLKNGAASTPTLDASVGLQSGGRAVKSQKVAIAGAVERVTVYENASGTPTAPVYTQAFNLLAPLVASVTGRVQRL